MDILYIIAPCLAPNKFDVTYVDNIIQNQTYRDASSITIERSTGKYANLINGEYLPTVSTLDNDLIYKKSNNSDIQIQYCAFRRSWKLVYLQEHHGMSYTIGRMKCVVKRQPLEYIKNIYWEIVVDDEMFEFQPYIQIHIFGEDYDIYNFRSKHKPYIM